MFPVDFEDSSQVRGLIDKLKNPEPILGSLENLYFRTRKIEDKDTQPTPRVDEFVPHMRLTLGITNNGVYVSSTEWSYKPEDCGYKYLDSLVAATVEYLTEQEIPLSYL